jgi:hypothetical protein
MGLLELLIVIVLIVWLTGTSLAIGGSTIHVLLVIVVILILYRLLTGRNAV